MGSPGSTGPTGPSCSTSRKYRNSLLEGEGLARRPDRGGLVRGLLVDVLGSDPRIRLDLDHGGGDPEGLDDLLLLGLKGLAGIQVILGPVLVVDGRRRAAQGLQAGLLLG